MQLPSIPQLMLGALLSWTCNGQLITITRTLNTCRPRTSISGVLTISPSLTSSGPPISYASTTTIASTVVVSPSPIDNTISAGASFTISVFPAGQSFPKRAVGQLYLTKYGYLSPDASQAAVFNLQDQQLLADGWLESAGFGAASAIFAASPSDGVGPITRAFTVKGGMIQWVYPTFEGGVAQFYIGLYNPPTKKEKRQAQSALYARFSGAPEPGWARASLGAALVSSSSSSASSVVAPTSTRASSIVAPTSTRATSVSIPLLPSEVPSSLQSFNPPGSSYIVSLPSVIISPSGNPQSSTTASSVVISLPSVIISPSGTPQSSTPAPSSTRSSSIAGVVSSTTSSAASQYTVPTYNGFCGADNFWTSCTGSNYGRCCSQYGVCGNDDAYCGVGCQSMYGSCGSLPGGSSVISLSSIVISPSASGSPVGPSTSRPASSSVSMSGVVLSSSSVMGPVSSSSSRAILSSSSVVLSATIQSSSSSILPSSSSVVAPLSSSLSVVVPPIPSLSSSAVISPTIQRSSSSTRPLSSSVVAPLSSSLSVVVPPISSLSVVVPPISSSGVVVRPTSSSVVAPPSSSSVMTSSTLPVQSITPSSTRQSSTGAAPTCTNVATPIACPANNGSYYNDAKIECSIGYAQFNVAGTGATAATIELCIDRCRNTTTCTAGVWQPGPKNCYLKTAVGTRSVNDANIAFYFPGGVTTGGQCAAAGSATSVPPIYSSSTMSSSAVVRPASSGSMLSSSSRMSSSTPPSPSPSSRVTPDGTCGGLNGYTCTGSQGGIQPCCSASGFCGIGPLYCGVGCQSLFGICDTISSSSSRVSSSSAPPVSSSASASPTPSSSSRAPSAISSSVVPSSSSSVLPSSSSSVVPSSSSSPSPSPFPSPTSSSFSSSVTMPPSSSSSVAPSTCAPGTTLHIPQPATPMPQLSCLDQDQDETFGSAVLPLNLQIYSISSNRVFANTNGLLSLNQGTSQYEHKPLPADNFDSTVLGIVFPMWTDMKMSASPSGDGVFYFANTTYAIFEWINYASYSDTARYQFTAAWNAATPTAWTFRYYLSGFEDGTAATVGLQGGLRGPALQWIYEQPLAAPGTQVVCDTNLNTCVVTAFDPTAP